MKKKKNAGFSLIELMVVVGIIGVLASMAIPRFQEFQAKARQSEAKTNLNYVATLQEAYYDDPANGNTYYTMGPDVVGPGTCPDNTLGFKPSPCNKLAYRYMFAAGAMGVTSFMVTATEELGMVFMCNRSADQWTIDESRTLGHPVSGMSC